MERKLLHKGGHSSTPAHDSVLRPSACALCTHGLGTAGRRAGGEPGSQQVTGHFTSLASSLSEGVAVVKIK